MIQWPLFQDKARPPIAQLAMSASADNSGRQQWSTCETCTLQARPCLLRFLGISGTWMCTKRAEIWLRKRDYASHWLQSYTRHHKMAYCTCVWSGWSCKMCKDCEWHYFEEEIMPKPQDTSDIQWVVSLPFKHLSYTASFQNLQNLTGK